MVYLDNTQTDRAGFFSKLKYFFSCNSGTKVNPADIKHHSEQAPLQLLKKKRHV